LATTEAPDPGQLVAVRQRHFVVTDVQRSQLPDDPLRVDGAPSHLVTLSSVEEDGLGEELQVIWEVEAGARLFEKGALPEPAGFDEPARLDAFLHAVRWGAVSSADVKALQAPFRAGIDIEDYQLDPVVRALQMPRVNLLIADDVGLGKTIESGLVSLELILRHRARRILVVCPASLQVQWREQMRDKFGLDFRIVDSALMKELRRRRGLHVNPWTHFPRLISSIDFLKRDRPLRLFRETLPSGDEPTYPRRYDLLIVDEAHNVAPSGSGNYTTDSLRTHAMRLLVPHFEHKLFVTATPHNGYRESFTALLELLDDQRFARGVDPDRDQLGAVMVRRMKTELKLKWDGSRRFPERAIEPIEVDYPDAEKRAHEALRRYAELRQESAKENDERFATEFVLKLLKKRLLSCPAAFAVTLEQHEATLRRGRAGKEMKPTLSVLRKQADAADEVAADDEEAEETASEAVGSATRLFTTLSSEEQRLLKALREYAQRASGKPDAKAQALLDWLQEHLKPDGRWGDERVIIFTEYRATQKWLHGILSAAGFAEKGRLLTLYGGMDLQDRERIKAAFQAGPEESRVRILLATDSASEGIDLQNHCSKMIHVEVPWNPNRLEQRNGRIDRHGQDAEEVAIFHFVPKGWQERAAQPFAEPGDLEGDLEFLFYAAKKVESIREDLGKVGPVIATQVEEAMLGKRSRLETDRAEREAEPVRRMLRFERRLRDQIERLREQLRESERELGISPANIQHAVQVGLELAGQPPLRETEVAGIWPDPTGRLESCPVFHLPPLKGSWARCSEGNPHPHTGKPRPIVFDPELASGRDDVVLAHLNHPLVQMSLRLLRAEVWSGTGQSKLHRVAARLVPSQALETPAVVAYGRLVVLGADSHRLHEEVITAGGVLREGRFARMNVGETNAALAAGLPHAAPAAVRKRLQDLWPSHREALFQSLETRMRDRTKNLGKLLAERADKEAEDLRRIMEELAAAIRTELDEPPPSQLEFWAAPEREQLERNEASLRRRLEEIPAEIERETEQLRQRYAEPTPRLFPVAVCYLVPEGIAREMEAGR